MNKKRSLLYFSVLVVPFIIDRVTKYWAINYALENCPVNQYLSFDLVINRGISWGMFHSPNPVVFTLVSSLIGLTVGLLGWYIWSRLQQQQFILGELLVMSGAISNLIDRVLHVGVVDFILFSCGSYSFPVFNVADVCIVVGLGIMVITSLCE